MSNGVMSDQIVILYVLKTLFAWFDQQYPVEKMLSFVGGAGVGPGGGDNVKCNVTSHGGRFNVKWEKEGQKGLLIFTYKLNGPC